MSIHEPFASPRDYVFEILNVAHRATAESAHLSGGSSIAGELAEIESLARRLLSKAVRKGDRGLSNRQPR